MDSNLVRYIELPRFRDALQIPPSAQLSCEFLAQGEYNRNYWFLHPVTGEKLVLRVNYGSQMHLEDQIMYEYLTLKALEPSGRTPRAVFADPQGDGQGHGIMVQEFIPGRHLDYGTDLEKAAACLADVHSAPTDKQAHLLRPPRPLQAILEECDQMFQVYRDSPLSDPEKRRRIDGLLRTGAELARRYAGGAYPLRCVNTELNNTNFLVDDSKGLAKLVDWEKPILGDPAQDLGHFLAPTTTFWKTDVILSDGQIDAFLASYLHAVHGRFDTDGLRERVLAFIPITCLRGLTWCAMAWVQYQQGGGLQNESTRKKLNEYHSWQFIQSVEEKLAR